MIEGTALRLRGWREDDLDVLTEMRNDLALQAELLARPRGSAVPQVRQWLLERTADPRGLLLIVANRSDDMPLGYLQLSEVDSLDRRAEIGICLHASAQGRGAGLETLTIMKPYLRNVWSLRKLTLRVRADNTRAIACYEKAGFAKCGLLREHVNIDGALRDLVLMEHFLHEEASACGS